MQVTSSDNIVHFKLNDNESVDAMMAYWDKDLICTFANNACMQWFGITPQQINKMHLCRFLGELYEQNLVYINDALNGENKVFERCITLPSGAIRKSRVSYFSDIFNEMVKGFFVYVEHGCLSNSDIKNVSEQTKKVHSLPIINDVLEEVLETLSDNIFKGFPGIVYISKKHFISQSKLKRDFKKKYKAPIFSYYRKLQMELAHKYISTRKYNKGQVANLLNFSNPSNFSVRYNNYIKECQKEELISKRNELSDDRYKIFIEQASMAFAMI